MISCESQSINLPQEKDETSASCQQNFNSPPQQKTTQNQIEKIIQEGSDSEFQAIVSSLAIALNKYEDLYSNKQLHYRLMKYFYRTFKAMNEDNRECQYQLIFIISLMAQIARKNNDIKLPFTKKIVLAILSFDQSILNRITYGCQMIKIIAVILSNLIKQGRTAIKLGVSNEVKNGLIRLISKVDDLFTLKILLDSVKTLLQGGKLNITKEQLQKNGVQQGLISHFGQIVANRLKIYLCHLAYQSQKSAQGKTLKDLIDQS